MNFVQKQRNVPKCVINTKIGRLILKTLGINIENIFLSSVKLSNLLMPNRFLKVVSTIG